MRSIAHCCITSNRATIPLVNTLLFIVCTVLSKHHTKQRKTGKYVARMRYVSVCIPMGWRRTPERHTMNVILT